MSMTPVPAQRSRLQRFADWTLDHDGTMYGDERERLRWYEAISVTASVHAFLVPSTLAVLIWVGGRPAAPYLLAVFAAFVLPTLISAAYVHRRQVRPRPERPDLKFVLVSVAFTLPHLVFVIGALRAYEGRVVVGSVVGAVVGGLVGVVAWTMLRVAAPEPR